MTITQNARKSHKGALSAAKVFCAFDIILVQPSPVRSNGPVSEPFRRYCAPPPDSAKADLPEPVTETRPFAKNPKKIKAVD